MFGRKLTSFNEGDINENSWRYVRKGTLNVAIVLFLVRVEKNLEYNLSCGVRDGLSTLGGAIFEEAVKFVVRGN